MVTEVR